MAEKKTVAKVEDDRVKPIVLRDQKTNDIYVLEFNRDSIKFAESRGFKIAAFDEGAVITTVEELFFYAFRMHQPKITRAETDKILYEKLGGMPAGMLERLVDLYIEPLKALRQDADEEGNVKNATMTAEF